MNLSTQKILASLAIMLFAKLAAAQLQPISAEQASSIKDALTMSWPDLEKFSCYRPNTASTVDSLRANNILFENIHDYHNSLAVNPNANQPLLVFTLWDDQPNQISRRVSITTDASFRTIKSAHYERYLYRKFNRGTLLNPIFENIAELEDEFICEIKN